MAYKLEDLSDVFTKEGVKKLKKGQLLRFNYEGTITEFIITHLNKKSGKVIGREVHTKLPSEVTVSNEYQEESFNEFVEKENG
jgi:hypothetical protein